MEKAVVLVGGAGKGIKPITGDMPKSLIRVVGKPVIERILDSLIACRFKEVILVSDQPRYFEEVTIKYGHLISVELIRQAGSDILGAILSASDLITGDTLLVYGDTLVPYDAYETVISTYYTYGKPVLMVIPEEDIRLYGAVKLGDLNKVVDFVEKPATEISGAYAYGGIAVINKELVEVLEESLSVEEGIRRFISRRSLIAAIWSGWWVDIGFPWDVLKANYYILSEIRDVRISSKASIASSAVIRGPVLIDGEVIIDHYVVLNGPLYIGSGCEVNTYSIIGKYSSLEGNNYVDTYSEVFWSSLQPNSIIGRNSYVYMTVAGSNAIIESNVITSTSIKKELIMYEKGLTVSRNLMSYLRRSFYVEHGSRVKAGSIIGSVN